MGSGAGITGVPILLSGGMFWFQLKDDGTTRYFNYSMDGVHFFTLYSEARATFSTPNQVGLLASSDTSALGDAGNWLLSYIEA